MLELLLLLVALLATIASASSFSYSSTSYLYPSKKQAWKLLGCFDNLSIPSEEIDVEEIDGVVRGEAAGLAEGERKILRRYPGSLLDCVQLAEDINMTVVGMHSFGECWSCHGDCLDKMRSQLSDLSHSISNYPYAQVGGLDAQSQPVTCLYSAASFEETEVDATTGAVISKNTLSSPFERMAASIYSVESREKLFESFFSIVDEADDNVCLMMFHPDFTGLKGSWPPPKAAELPAEFWDIASLRHRVPVMNFYFAEEMWKSDLLTEWKNETLTENFQKNYCFRGKKERCKYCSFNCLDLFSKYAAEMSGKSALVVGSSTPWLESSLTRAGASHIFTVEYRMTVSHLPHLTTLVPSQLGSIFRSGSWAPVDMAFAFSTIEHSGLGRYGDALQTQADFVAMGQLLCLLKPGGILFLTVPTGPDILVYNAHRTYGRHRLPLLLRGWELLDVIGEFNFDSTAIESDNYSEPILVLRKPM